MTAATAPRGSTGVASRRFRVSFLGGAGTVTGSRFLVETPGGARLLVDCGLYQGVKRLRLRNWEPFAFDPASLDAVVLTHAHIDHSGMLPVLVREGFRGPIHATPATSDLAGVLLPDSGHLQEEDADFANRRGFSRHHPARPLYTEDDARRVLPLLADVNPGAPFAVGDATLRFRHAGHILGAAQVELRAGDASLLFSGDLGQAHDPICFAPEAPPAVGAVVMESTYGDRLHVPGDPVATLAALVRDVAASGGTLLVPAFAVGRVQAILYWLDRAFAAGDAPRLPVVVDSPMSTSVTDLYRRHAGTHRLGPEEAARVFSLARFVARVEESKALAGERGPMVLISASGMLTGGRVLHHFKRLAPDPASVILLPGFQAPGTRGARLVAGADTIKVHGGMVPVRARVVQHDAFSAHADRDALVSWLASAEAAPASLVLVHGEPAAADELRLAVASRLGIDGVVAEHGETMELG